jgi:ferredoxin--NADP+ reductase
MGMYPHYTYVPLTTREPDTAGKKLYIQDLIAGGRVAELLGRPLEPESTHIFLCGNPKMIGVPLRDPRTGERSYPQPAGVIEILETRFGFRADDPAARLRGNFHYEEYW